MPQIIRLVQYDHCPTLDVTQNESGDFLITFDQGHVNTLQIKFVGEVEMSDVYEMFAEIPAKLAILRDA